jgi:hypothetical protein
VANSCFSLLFTINAIIHPIKVKCATIALVRASIVRLYLFYPKIGKICRHHSLKNVEETKNTGKLPFNKYDIKTHQKGKNEKATVKMAF